MLDGDKATALANCTKAIADLVLQHSADKVCEGVYERRCLCVCVRE